LQVSVDIRLTVKYQVTPVHRSGLKNLLPPALISTAK
jgi:hypothetical protein